VRKLTATGQVVITERQGLGKGFPPSQVKRGPVTVGCGHIMHYTCFELYYAATQRRQAHQIARNHPERLARKEFVCPLCKALGNAFLPIIWRGKEEVYPASSTRTVQ
jgi:E3 ubiquitin-protein ligase UBR1